MFVFRPVQQKDHEAVLNLAQILGSSGSISLKADALQAQIQKSISSFLKPQADRSKNLYMFVLEDQIRKLIVGSSLIFAKHGTPESPHTYLEVIETKREDAGTGIQKTHQLLRFEFDTDGPTEIGGLILHPDYQKLPIGLGRQLSYSRFLYMALYPERFESNVIAELLPPFNEDGTSELWEALGKRFTGLDYHEADRLSRTNKDFIKNLFPSEDIYTCLFSEKARMVIGQTGAATSGARKLLEKIGFRYMNSVDPFDGGPHFGAKTKEISLIKRLKKASISTENLSAGGKRSLMAAIGKNGFFACSGQLKETSDNEVQIGPDLAEIFRNELGEKQELYWVHLI